MPISPQIPLAPPASTSSASAAGSAISPGQPAPAGDSATIERVTRSLDCLECLSQMLTCEDDYQPAQLDYELPRGFRLTVVIPVYNEERTIERVLARVAALPLPIEVLVVDDCSTDGTRRVLDRLHRFPEVEVIFKPQNEGKGAALRTAFRRASGDIVVVQDADLEYDPRDIVSLIRPLVLGQADVAFGSRFLDNARQDRSLVHRLGNHLLTKASNALTGLKITDMETCYKAFRREVLRSFEIEQNRFGFEPEVTAKLARRKARVVEVPISYAARGYADGKKIGAWDLLNALYCIVRYGLWD